MAIMTIGCSNANETSETTTSAVSTETSATEDTVITPEDIGVDDVDVDNLSYEDLKAKYLELYTKKSADEKFITDSEALTYESYGFTIRNEEYGWIAMYSELWHEENDYYRPVLLTENIIVYVCDDGNLGFFDLNGEQKKTWINIHGNFSDENLIETTADYAIVSSDSGVSLWKFGEESSEANLPDESIYAGFSYWQGYIFRAGTDIYSVAVGDTGDLTSTPIAHGVDKVIVTDYRLNSDAWSQPLFQMEDGSIKAYCIWKGNQDADADDASHLVDIEYEGGYPKK